MKGTLAGFVALPLFVAALTAWGQDLPADTQDFKAKRHSNDADDLLATVASFRETLNDDGKIRLYYNVCNHASKALLFRWPKPGFETGITHPLASKKCAVYARDVVQSVLDDQASVLYWQRSDSRTASAFIEKQSAWEKAKHSASTFLYSRGLGHGPERPDQIRDVEVVVAETNQWLEHKIRWSGDAITVAMRLGTGDGEQILGINQQLAAQGPLAKESAVLEAKKFVATLHKEDQVRLPASAREGHVVVLKSQAKEDGAAQFRYQVVDTSPDVQPIVVIGADGRIVWVAQYATVRGK